MSLPTTMKALVGNQTNDGSLVKEVPVPKLNDGDVLVKVAYVSQNPTDWKHVATRTPPDGILGCDFSGTVVAVSGGEEKHRAHLKPGTRVAGVVHGGLFPDKGAFAEYVVTPADLVWVVPDSFSLSDASTFGIPFNTTVQALVHSQKAPWPPAKQNEWIFIYGGSTGVGFFATQIAKLQGYKVVTVASPRNHDLVKSYGADEVFDYKDADAVVANVLKVTGGGVSRALDTISEGNSQEITIKTFGPKGGQLNLLLPADPVAQSLRPDVNVVFLLAYTLFGLEFNFGERDQTFMLPAVKEDLEFHREAVSKTAALVENFGLKAPPVTIRGGLEDIPAGFQEMQEGKVSAKRLVYKVAGGN
ncbi:Protein TOXD [Vanrija pseudolonga]|uniref:Protein TOXD n=1 Tax=Vanrija pseudolonga TaxID=143232 RepID=A0AAF0Y656_9TREE|nr:Protein TOXD [Vanrija pseudolonga]